jgi:hypothetical protein
MSAVDCQEPIMTTTTQTAPEQSLDPADAWTLPELIARQLTCMHLIDGRLVQLVATPGQDYVALDISYPFPPSSHMRVMLELCGPIDFDSGGVVDAQILDDAVEIGASA